MPHQLHPDNLMLGGLGYTLVPPPAPCRNVPQLMTEYRSILDRLGPVRVHRALPSFTHYMRGKWSGCFIGLGVLTPAEREHYEPLTIARQHVPDLGDGDFMRIINSYDCDFEEEHQAHHAVQVYGTDAGYAPEVWGCHHLYRGEFRRLVIEYLREQDALQAYAQAVNEAYDLDARWEMERAIDEVTQPVVLA